MALKNIFACCFCLVCGVTTVPAQKQLTGKATYYSDKLHGRKMSNGERYHRDSMTCAHKKYPFGTLLKVRNPLNGKEVVVRVTDRGPFSKRYVIDLSKAAARELGFIRKGFCQVEITRIHPNRIPFRPEDAEEIESAEEEATAEEADKNGTGLTVSVPLDKAAVGNLTNLLTAKESLIKKALGINDLGIEVTEDVISFPWFSEMPEPDAVKAYTHFIAALCKMSKDLKRASATEKDVDNEKYAFRCFLLRLGFIGNEYKAERKILLKNLSGNSSWKNGAPEKEEAACE